MPTAQPIGHPELPTTQSQTRHTNVYGEIPPLTELLEGGGIAGYAYAQVCLHNLRNVQDDPTTRWFRVKGLDVYSIEGPKGSVEMMLVCTGTPVIGQGQQSGKRICWHDAEITEATGLPTDPNFTAHFNDVINTPGDEDAA